MTFVPNLVIFLVLLAHLLLLRSGPGEPRLALIRPDSRLILLILLLATMFGPISYGIFAALLYSGLTLVLDRYFAQNAPKS